MVDGEVIESSNGRQPLSYVQGSGQIIPGLEEELEDMEPGEKKRVTVPPEKAYGVHNPEAVHQISKDAFQNAESMNEGDMVKGQMGDQPFHGTIQSIDDQTVTLDLNHPLAGKTLEFDVEVVEVG
ncbi:MAG: FKBP-type peptidyl-prolyl cis-trans isomerase [Acidobacteriota bacterium]